MSEPRVIRPAEETPVERGPGLQAIPLIAAQTGAVGFINGLTSFQPGAAVPLHTHNVQESITILEGEAVCEVAGKEYTVRPFDTVHAPAGVPHCFRNESEEPMRFLWCYGGTKVTRTYLGTGQTVEHLSAADSRAISQPGSSSSD